MVHGKNSIPCRIDWRLTGLAGPDYDAPISFGLPIEPEDSQYRNSRVSKVRRQRVFRHEAITPPVVFHLALSTGTQQIGPLAEV